MSGDERDMVRAERTWNGRAAEISVDGIRAFGGADSIIVPGLIVAHGHLRFPKTPSMGLRRMASAT